MLKQIITEEETFRIFFAKIDTIWEIHFLNASYPILTSFSNLMRTYKVIYYYELTLYYSLKHKSL